MTLGLYFVLSLLMEIPAVQRGVSHVVASSLSDYLQTDVRLGHLDISLWGRLRIDDLQIRDRQCDTLLSVGHAAVHIDVPTLIRGKVVVTTAQLFDFYANLYQQKKDGPYNFQFLLDAFASNDTTPSRLDLRLNTMVLRRGRLALNHWYEAPRDSGRFDPHHLRVDGISGHIALKALNHDSLNVRIKSFQAHEASGLTLDRLALHLLGGRRQARLQHFELVSGTTCLNLDTLRMAYNLDRSNPLQTLSFDGAVRPSTVDLRSFTPLVSGLSHIDTPLYLEARFRGDADAIEVHHFNCQTTDGSLGLTCSAVATQPYEDSRTVDLDLHTLHADSVAFRHIFTALGTKAVPQPLIQLGMLQSTGRAIWQDHLLKAALQTTTSCGNIQIQGSCSEDGDIQARANVQTFDLGRLLSVPTLLGPVTLTLAAQGHLDGSDSYGDGKLSVSELLFKGHTYQNLQSTASYHGRHGHLTLQSTQPEATFTLDAEAWLQGKQRYKAQLTVDELAPHALGLTRQYEGDTFRGRLEAEVTGHTLEEMLGTATVRAFSLSSPDHQLNVDSLVLAVRPSVMGRELSLHSDFLDASFEGSFAYKDLAHSFTEIMRRYLPSLYLAKGSQAQKQANSYRFNLCLRDGTPLRLLAGIPLSVGDPVMLGGEYNDGLHYLSLQGTIPDLTYDTHHLRRGRLEVDGSPDKLKVQFEANKVLEDIELVINFNALAHDDLLDTQVAWNNQLYHGNISGTMDLQSSFFRQDNDLGISVKMRPSQLLINDTIWNVHPACIDYGGGHLQVKDFLIDYQDRHLAIDGQASASSADTLWADLRNIPIKYVLDMVNFHTVDLVGPVTGKAHATEVFSSPTILGNLAMSHLSLNDGPMGRLAFHGGWDARSKKIQLHGVVTDSVAQAVTTIDGYVIPSESLDLYMTAHHSNLYFLNDFASDIFDHIQGRGTGHVRVFGPDGFVNIEGGMRLNAFDATVKSTGVHYAAQPGDSATIDPGLIRFHNIHLFDDEGHPGMNTHTGTVNGYLRHHYFKDMSFDFDIQASHIKGFETTDFAGSSFYGTVYGTGRVGLRGNPRGVTIDIQGRPDEGTLFVYNTTSPGDVVSSSKFLTFRSARQDSLDAAIQSQAEAPKTTEDPHFDNDLRMNFLLDINPSATVKVIMDPISGDYITLAGTGSIRADYYNKGRFQMYGSVETDHGLYKLSLQEVIRKDFQIKPGGTITFSGNPMDGILNMQAVYTLANVPLSDLGNGTFSQTGVRVNCLMNLEGRCNNPQVNFDIDLPTVSEDERQMVRSYMGSAEEKNLQAIYLLGVGRFYNTLSSQNTATNTPSQSSLAMQSLLSTTLSGQLNQVLGNAIQSSNWNFGANVSTGQLGLSEVDARGSLSGSLLHNRLLINGNFGYRESKTSVSTFVGDFDIQYLLNKKGTISLKAYNETNDRYFTKSSLNTQGIGIILKRDFSSWLDLFRRPRTLKKPTK